MSDETKPVETQGPVADTSIKTPEVVESTKDNEVKDQVSVEPPKEEVKKEPENQDKDKEKYNAYKTRREKENQELRAELEKKNKILQSIIQQPPQEGEEFDPILGANIPKNMPASEYRQLLVQKSAVDSQEASQRDALASLKTKANLLREEIPDAKVILEAAEAGGVIDQYMFVAASDLSDDIDGLKFLTNLIKENPQKLRELSSINPMGRAAKLGAMYNEYKNKPLPRETKTESPSKPLSEVGQAKDFIATNNSSKLSSREIDTNKLKAFLNRNRGR